MLESEFINGMIGVKVMSDGMLCTRDGNDRNDGDNDDKVDVPNDDILLELKEAMMSMKLTIEFPDRRIT